jgi:phosphatidylglycerophosphatase A
MINRKHKQIVTANTQPSLRLMFSHWAHSVSFGFGAGLLKPAPGTWGSLMGLALFLGLKMADLVSSNALIWLGICFCLFVVGVWCCSKTGQALGVSDHGAIVWDEIVALFLVCYAVRDSALGYALGFVLFRIFDIIKPQPIAWLDARVKGGFGVMIDDILAAVFAIVCYHGLAWIWPNWF